MKVGVYHFHHQGRRVFLVDTPGFDDTNRSDSEVLKDVAFWLAAAYAKSTQLAGIIYLHRISDVRMGGSALRNLRMFKQLCGANNLSSVILATTHWSTVSDPVGSEREQELMQTEDFWGGMVGRGSQVVRHDGSKQSALKIITDLVGRRIRITLDIQKQWIDQQRNLSDTDAGQALQEELIAERKKFEGKLTELKEDMDLALKEKDQKWQEQIKKDKAMYDEKIKQTYSQTEELRTDIKRIAKEKEEQYAVLQEEMREERERSEALLAETRKNLKEAQAARDKVAKGYKRRAEAARERHEQRLLEIATEMRETHDANLRAQLDDDRREREAAYKAQKEAERAREYEREKRWQAEKEVNQRQQEQLAAQNARLELESRKSESFVRSIFKILIPQVVMFV